MASIRNRGANGKFRLIDTENDREILQGEGKMSAELAKSHAEREFDKFRVLDDRHFESDFDRMVKQLPTKIPGKGTYSLNPFQATLAATATDIKRYRNSSAKDRAKYP